MTIRGHQRFVFYTGPPEWTTKLRNPLQEATGVGALRVNCDSSGAEKTQVRLTSLTKSTRNSTRRPAQQDKRPETALRHLM